MKAFKALRVGLTSFSTVPPQKPYLTSTSFSFFRFYSAEPQSEDTINVEDYVAPAFDSSDYSFPTVDDLNNQSTKSQTTWDESYRKKADRVIFGVDTEKSISRTDEKEETEERRRANLLAKALLQAALERPDDVEEEDMIVKEEDQKSLSVGIVGAPNAGKSALTNFMVSFLFH